MVVVVQPGSPTLDGIVLQPTVFLTVRDDVPSQLDMMAEPVLDLIETHPQFLVVRFPLAQPLSALRLTGLPPAALLDLPCQEEIRLRVVIGLWVVGENASFPDILSILDGLLLQLLPVVVITIEQRLLVELPLQTDLITCIHLVTVEDVEHVGRGERQQRVRVVTHRLQEGGVCLKPDDRESRQTDDVVLSRTTFKHALHEQQGLITRGPMVVPDPCHHLVDSNLLRMLIFFMLQYRQFHHKFSELSFYNASTHDKWFSSVPQHLDYLPDLNTQPGNRPVRSSTPVAIC